MEQLAYSFPAVIDLREAARHILALPEREAEASLGRLRCRRKAAVMPILMIENREQPTALLVASFGLENWRSGAHGRPMDDPIQTKFAGLLAAVGIAAMVAFTVGYIAHYDFGVSRFDIRMAALMGAATIAPLVVMLLAIEYLEKNLRKPK
jgi:hypothetical protein